MSFETPGAVCTELKASRSLVLTSAGSFGCMASGGYGIGSLLASTRISVELIAPCPTAFSYESNDADAASE
jgi:hypothetical protein